MMRLLAMSPILVLLATFSYGQKSSDKVADEICKCIEAKIPNITENQHLKDTVNACFGKGMATDFAGLRKEYKMKGEGITVEQVREIRDRLWKKLEKNCERFKKVLAEL